jgi:hypothetical protein
MRNKNWKKKADMSGIWSFKFNDPNNVGKVKQNY